jgi:pimeloyl-ACP methyl ester carboxylesterase
VIQAVGEPVFLLGHSYGAHCSLAAAALAPKSIRKLVLYEAPWPHIVSPEAVAPLEELAAAGAWEDFAITFFRDILSVPMKELEALRATELWSLTCAL